MPAPLLSCGPLPVLDRFATDYCNPWLFKDSQLLEVPSTRHQRPMSLAEETWCRHRACMFLDRVGSKEGDQHMMKNGRVRGLDLKPKFVSTAKVLLHRFYMCSSFQDSHYHEVCGALLYLCAKMGEGREARALSDVVLRCALSAKKAPVNEKDLQTWTNRIKFWEGELLYRLSFDLLVDLPHGHAMKIIQDFHGSKELQSRAFQYCNDALLTTLTVRARSEHIAHSAIYLASFKLNEPLERDGQQWWQELGIEKRRMQAYAYEIVCAKDEKKVRAIVKERTTLLKSKRKRHHVNDRPSKRAKVTPVTPSPSSPSKTPQQTSPRFSDHSAPWSTANHTTQSQPPLGGSSPFLPTEPLRSHQPPPPLPAEAPPTPRDHTRRVSNARPPSNHDSVRGSDTRRTSHSGRAPTPSARPSKSRDRTSS
ncbi:uncharacterized protein SPPG_08432 [Spizellomyces punctatus DAOM BR117]|uniref:Uncharacterized protein n=1 Tax=Spizellomyces punctatus (strain DAOM BR117) TaxID=645134 RepID=A0A0L0H463_SPIPD|nr:uncharacterized protein SPPG_08432 [Spizellomyces punctatus DAOM BR117]KNC96280.1 hypothetical protein SPPG_08432 [Spizellomyces punctatus DAOM BR117]|eukprot:XP_016604320.1 hypothetical protein SPPG_08432 [Spizellomyces punctatus DAOM BR117]